jgi:hypothetical protein
MNVIVSYHLPGFEIKSKEKRILHVSTKHMFHMAAGTESNFGKHLMKSKRRIYMRALFLIILE